MNTDVATMTTMDLLEWANSIDTCLTFEVGKNALGGEIVFVGNTSFLDRRPGIWLEAGRSFSEYAFCGPGPAIGLSAKCDLKGMSGNFSSLEKLRRTIELRAAEYELIDKQPRLF